MQTENEPLHGRLRALLLFDVAEEIDLSQVHTILGTKPSRREPAFRHPAPEYVRFERPPVMEDLGITQVHEDQQLHTRVRYFEYGVASVEFQTPFEASWDTLLWLAQRWVLSPALEGLASSLLRDRLVVLKDILRKPYEGWITEDYYIVQLDPIQDGASGVLSAEELVRQRGAQIAQVVRGEEIPLSTAERQEVLEYANTQLLEFRYYDEVLTRVLADVYDRLDVSHGILAPWKLAGEAGKLNTIRLDCQELTERTDNAIKFLSDMFYARVYRLASARIGVTDYRELVTEKLATARDLYDSMVN